MNHFETEATKRKQRFRRDIMAIDTFLAFLGGCIVAILMFG